MDGAGEAIRHHPEIILAASFEREPQPLEEGSRGVEVVCTAGSCLLRTQLPR